MRIVTRWLSIVIPVVMSISGHADQLNSSKLISTEQLKEDFQQLYAGLQLGSYDLYAHRSKAEFDSMFARGLTELDEPLTVFEAQKRFMKFAAHANIAHTRIDFPMADFMSFIDQGGKTLPLSFSIDDNEVRVDQYFGLSDKIKHGHQVLSVDGISVNDWLKPLRGYLSADNAQLRNELLEQMVAPLLWLDQGQKESYHLKLKDPISNNVFEIVQVTLTQDKQSQQTSESQTQTDSKPREYKVIDGAIGYLKPGPFYNVYATNEIETWDNTEFKTFIDDAFKHFIEANVSTIVIDITGNPGGTNSFSDLMLAWFADKPFRFASDFRIKVSALSRAANQARFPKSGSADDITTKLEDFYSRHQEGDVISFPLDNSLPNAKPHSIVDKNINVFVWIDRFSYSNAVSVAAIAQDYQFATVIGEKTSDLATTYGAMEHFKLTHTGIQVGYPKALIIRPNGEAQPDGVTPDVIIPNYQARLTREKRLKQVLAFLKSSRLEKQ
ncbi:S41 family peptidase [Pleionea litopenaei]|uniref:S41 family peptidase n=1 Tax=Pleionea litopenaei TaxID=3070815 RepID=A0AA51X625_9GAMM|nr:S41 family peptidase [Pleionea sp. HL-JVS1]WMS85645.1 S41 family peptidase [Pleionea sp. HL-JVS1]